MVVHPAKAAAPTNPPPAVAAENADLQHAQNRLKELAADNTLSEAQKGKLVEVYRQIVARWQSAREFEARAQTYREALTTAPEQISQIRAQISRAALAEPAPSAELEPGLDAEQLQQRQAQADAELRTQQDMLHDLEKQLEEIQRRPAQARTELAAATARLEQIGQDLSQPEPSADAPELERAQRALLQARQRARTAEVQALGQELLSRSARADLLAARRDLALLRISQLESVRGRLQTQLAQSWQLELQRLRDEVQQVLQPLAGNYAPAGQLGKEITNYAGEASSLGQKMNQAQTRRVAIEAQLDQVKAHAGEAKRLLGIGVSGLLGQTLLELRRDLPNLQTLNHTVEEYARQMSENRLRLFKLDRELKGLSNLNRATADWLSTNSVPAVLAAEEPALTNRVARLLMLKRESLQRLTKAYRDYVSELSLMESLAQELSREAKKLAVVLEEQLLWTRNAPPLGRQAFHGVATDLARLAAWSSWRETGRVLGQDLTALPGAYLLVLIAAIALGLVNRRLLQHLERMAPKVGKVRKDHIGLTLAALGIHLLCNVPVFLALGFVAWRLWTVGGTEFPRAIGFGLAMAAGTGFVIQFFRGTCRPFGIGPVHFRWKDRVGELLRHHLLWFLMFAVPLAFFVGFSQRLSDPFNRPSLGRLALVLLMLAAAGLAWVLLDRRRGLPGNDSPEGLTGWKQRLRGVWQPLGVVAPLGIAALAAAGYYYSAIQIEYRLNQTLLLILAVVLLYGLLHRWMLISQRRLALRVALEKRDVQARSPEAEEAETAREGVLEMLEEINVGEVKEQTQHLLRLSVTVMLLFGLWFVWAGIFPAFVVLDRVPLWDHTVLVDGQERLAPVTLADLALAMVIGLVTVLAARNMPGFLEITLLQRLPLDSGTRYATRTLVLYVISITGLVLAFKALGIGWSSVQWLAAALTVGLGFGLQEIFANFVSGLILLLERPIRVGDTVTVGEISGIVSRIRMRATTITDWNRKELIVPNKNFITGELVNWTLSDPILRLIIPVGIAYGSDTELARRIMLEVCQNHPDVLKQPEPAVYFLAFGDNALNFEVRVFVSETGNRGRSRILNDLHLAIDQACRRHNINIAFPQRDLHLKTADAVLRITQMPPPDNQPPPSGTKSS